MVFFTEVGCGEDWLQGRVRRVYMCVCVCVIGGAWGWEFGVWEDEEFSLWDSRKGVCFPLGKHGELVKLLCSGKGIIWIIYFFKSCDVIFEIYRVTIIFNYFCAQSLKLCLTLWGPMDCSLPGSSVWNSPGKNTGVGCHFLFQGIFPTQGLNLCLLHW